MSGDASYSSYLIASRDLDSGSCLVGSDVFAAHVHHAKNWDWSDFCIAVCDGVLHLASVRETATWTVNDVSDVFHVIGRLSYSSFPGCEPVASIYLARF